MMRVRVRLSANLQSMPSLHAFLSPASQPTDSRRCQPYDCLSDSSMFRVVFFSPAHLPSQGCLDEDWVSGSGSGWMAACMMKVKLRLRLRLLFW